MGLLKFCFIGLTLALSIATAQDVVIDINPNEARLPLGFLEFEPAPGEMRKLPLDPGRVISDDLEFSGRVKIIDALNADSSTLKYFLMNEAYAYIEGSYRYSGEDIEVNCFLRDAETQEVIIGKKYTTNTRGLRQTAHKFSDELVYQLFGERGIFQTKILFSSKQSGNKEIYLMDYDGANPTRVTRNGSTNLFPAWLRDNRSIIFTSYQGGSPQLYQKTLPNGAEKIFQKSKYLNTGSDYNPVDGEIVYTSSIEGNTEIFRISENGTNRVRLTYSKSLEASPSWAPNGYEIAFTSSRAGAPMIYVMDRDGSNIRRLTYEGKYCTSPAWSPKGDKIAYCCMVDGGHMDIFTISPNGQNTRRLTGGQGSNESPSWSPDGRALVFSSTRMGRTEIFQMLEDGSNQRQITNFGQNSSPNWSNF